MRECRQILTIQDVEQFRTTFREFVSDVTEGEFVPPVALVNDGYLHTFNASFDGLFLREQQTDSLLAAKRPMNFGAIQPCIRADDKQANRKSDLHLALFEIYGVSILGLEKMSAYDMACHTIREFVAFCSDHLCIDTNDLRIFVSGGGTLRRMTDGLIKNDDYISPDTFSASLWSKFGITSSQVMPEYTRETFLLHVGQPLREHHVGYRNDIFMHVGDSAYEVATLNFISHQTVIEGDEIVAIRPLPFYLREIAIGQERILSAMAGSADLYELPYLAPLVQRIQEFVHDRQITRVCTDALRAVHYLFADGGIYASLRGRRFREHRQDLNKLMAIVDNMESEVGERQLRAVLDMNAGLQPWHPQLKEAVGVTIDQLKRFRYARKSPHNAQRLQP